MHRFSTRATMYMIPLAGAVILASFADAAEVRRDLEYAQVGDISLRLDLYLPEKAKENAKRPPLLVWVHGGAWRSGSKDNMPLGGLVERGFAVASVEYRLSPVARFPAQVHDINGAIRYLRASAKELGVDAARIGIVGSSAGGHLAALVGVTNGVKELEGDVGGRLDQSSDVQAIVDLYGPTNFLTILKQSTPHGLNVRVPALELLLGGQPEDKPDLARLASPVFHVDEHDPPLLLLYGDQDPQVPINQAHELKGAYLAKGMKAKFIVVYGAAHGGKEFYDEERVGKMAAFFDRHLRKVRPEN